jgi:hypothetical protein
MKFTLGDRQFDFPEGAFAKARREIETEFIVR